MREGFTELLLECQSDICAKKDSEFLKSRHMKINDSIILARFVKIGLEGEFTYNFRSLSQGFKLYTKLKRLMREFNGYVKYVYAY